MSGEAFPEVPAGRALRPLSASPACASRAARALPPRASAGGARLPRPAPGSPGGPPSPTGGPDCRLRGHTGTPSSPRREMPSAGAQLPGRPRCSPSILSPRREGGAGRRRGPRRSSGRSALLRSPVLPPAPLVEVNRGLLFCPLPSTPASPRGLFAGAPRPR